SGAKAGAGALDPTAGGVTAHGDNGRAPIAIHYLQLHRASAFDPNTHHVRLVAAHARLFLRVLPTGGGGEDAFHGPRARMGVTATTRPDHNRVEIRAGVVGWPE